MRFLRREVRGHFVVIGAACLPGLTWAATRSVRGMLVGEAVRSATCAKLALLEVRSGGDVQRTSLESRRWWADAAGST
jgi:hypothetical protein